MKPDSAPTALAKSILKWLDEHPVPKLLGMLWLMFAPVWSVYDGWSRQRLEDKRAGLTTIPKVELSLLESECRLLNADVRPIVEATLTWREFEVDAGACAIRSMAFPLAATSAERELLPRNQLIAKYDEDDLMRARQNHRALFAQIRCSDTGGANCVTVLECKASYHRAADLMPYERSTYAFIQVGRGGSVSLVPLQQMFELRDKRAQWADSRQHDAWNCFGQRLAALQNLEQRSADLEMERRRIETP